MRTIVAGVAGVAAALVAQAAQAQVLELRQYKIAEGQRDAFVTLFEREFVESQEAEGIRLVGQFRDLDDPSRFTWIRAFPDAASRAPALTRFYTGPIWRRLRNDANALLVDNDNVLLLKPAGPDLGLPEGAVRAAPGASAPPAGLVVVNLWRLWTEPDAAFAETFARDVKPELKAAGLDVVGAYLPERSPNTFPQLPVREGEKLFVWFARAPSAEAYAKAIKAAEARPGWKAKVAPLLAEKLESPPLVRRLAPTPRSALR